MRRAALGIGCLLLAACRGSGDHAVRVELQLRASCLPSTHYDVSCVQALRLDVRDGDSNTLASGCTSLDGRYATMQDMLAEPSSLSLLTGVQVDRPVRVELRGYQVIDKPPCTDLTDEEIMFWGASRLVDLADPSLTTLPVEVECRPMCDCSTLEIMAPTCPAALTPGACAPAPTQLCRTQCDDDHGCYDGLMHCGDRICVPEPQAMCADCASDAECTSGLCVVNTRTGEHFCSSPCPPLPAVDPCPTWMSCKSLTSGTFTRAWTSPGTQALGAPRRRLAPRGTAGVGREAAQRPSR
jgi:hypothetical protein